MGRIIFATPENKSKLPLEVEIQKQSWAWLGEKLVQDADGNLRPLQDWAYHVPNGTQLGGGRQRRAQYMSSLKAQGLRPGVSDIVIAYPRGGYHGAYFELKRDAAAYKGPAALKASIRPEQRKWLSLMERTGYWVCIPYGFESFQSLVTSYVRNETQPPLDRPPGK